MHMLVEKIFSMQTQSSLLAYRSQENSSSRNRSRCHQFVNGLWHVNFFLEGLYKSKLQDSVQLQTVVALHDQKTIRNNGQPSYSRHQSDYMIRTRNFRVPNEIAEKGATSKSREGKRAYVERKLETAFSGSKTDSVPNETHVVSPMILYLETCTRVREEKDDRLFPAPDTKAKTDAQELFKSSGSRGQSPWRGRERFPCRSTNCEVSSCRYMQPPVCQNSLSEQDAVMATSAILDMVRRIKKPRKKSRKGVVLKEEWRYGRSLYKWVVCLKIPSRENLFQRRAGKWGSDLAVRVSNSTWHQRKIRERRGPSRGITQRREPHERCPCAP